MGSLIDTPALILKPGREKSLRQHHPWVFSGAVSRLEGEAEIGQTVRILDNRGDFLAWGAYSPFSQIRARIWSWQPEEQIGPDFLRRRLQHAISLRQDLGVEQKPQSAQRLVYAESDGLPGVIADRYADWLVVQYLTAGAEYWREVLNDLLCEVTGLRQLYERSDAEVRELEGLQLRSGPIRGERPSILTIEENGLHFQVDISQGHKTGFYLDQRQNRQRLRKVARGREVLDCFCYTGGFTLNALVGGAYRVVAVDSSSEALELLRRNVRLNHLSDDQVETIAGDVFQVLRRFRDQGKSFDLIILDPPKFAPTTAQVERAARGYKDINLLAFKLLRPGGLLFTFSCSGGVEAALFQKIVASAALDAGVSAQIIGYLHQAEDHPVALNFPESAYLKGLVVQVG